MQARLPMSISFCDRMFMKFSCCFRCKKFDARRQQNEAFQTAMDRFSGEIDIIKLAKMLRITELMDSVKLTKTQRSVVKYFRSFHVSWEDLGGSGSESDSDGSFGDEVIELDDFRPSQDPIDDIIYFNIFKAPLEA